jgi:uncharacterized membrane protein YoaK (UPF0700 family)
MEIREKQTMQAQRSTIEDVASQQILRGPTIRHWTQTRAQWAVAVLLAIMAGYLDGYGFFFLKTYVSFMSGNTTSTGLKIGQGAFQAAIPSAIAILFFVIGSFLGNALTQSKLRHSHRLAFGLIAILLAIITVLQWSGLSHVNTEIVFLCLAMGITNPALSKIGAEAVSVTFVTGTLSRIGGYLASAATGKPVKEAQRSIETPLFREIADSQLSRAWVEATIWSSFLVGAVLAGIAGTDFRMWALLPPFIVVLALSLFSSVD